MSAVILASMNRAKSDRYGRILFAFLLATLLSANPLQKFTVAHADGISSNTAPKSSLKAKHRKRCSVDADAAVTHQVFT